MGLDGKQGILLSHWATESNKVMNEFINGFKSICRAIYLGWWIFKVVKDHEMDIKLENNKLIKGRNRILYILVN